MRTHNLMPCLGIVCAVIVVCSLPETSVAAETGALYERVLDAFEALPREAGIAVDLGVEDGRYAERFTLTAASFRALAETSVPQAARDHLTILLNREFESPEDFMQAVGAAIGQEQAAAHAEEITNSAYDGKAAFAFGDRFEARFRADADCYVALIHLGVPVRDAATGRMSGGKMTVLLPNRNAPAARLEAGRTYSTAHDFEISLVAGPPPGHEVFTMLCSTEPFELFAEDGVFWQDYAVIASADDAALQQLLTGLQQAAAADKFGGTSLLLQIGGATRDLPRKFGRLKPMGGTGTTGKFFPPVQQP